MKIIVRNSTKIVQLNGLPCRIWEGETSGGIPVHCYIAGIAVDRRASPKTKFQFEIELDNIHALSKDFEVCLIKL